ncbi:MAG: hypothetical protein COT00_02430 [Candidatus Omnitrophica bacterium CG07_land_8_20_14_0_80_50_8]|nr:MAG: hypothetical protein AUJ71_04760 [Candidatus Omnitrophica bacterium CG1_02_49_16]PIU40301.1 MAG: hypothetical protein COT00_02430 [Candidatus Omnitrophica bacterium CG07_land_8_20_14_0_80_50_8]
MNKKYSFSLKDVSLTLAELMPNIMRGVQLDFFARRSMTQPQFMMMVAIHSYGQCRMTNLAGGMKIKMPTATGLADRLASAGYVRRFNEPDDRRVVLLELTPKGRKFIIEFKKMMRRRWEEVLEPLDARELSAFYRAIIKLTDHLRASS